MTETDHREGWFLRCMPVDVRVGVPGCRRNRWQDIGLSWFGGSPDRSAQTLAVLQSQSQIGTGDCALVVELELHVEGFDRFSDELGGLFGAC